MAPLGRNFRGAKAESIACTLADELLSSRRTSVRIEGCFFSIFEKNSNYVKNFILREMVVSIDWSTPMLAARFIKFCQEL